MKAWPLIPIFFVALGAINFAQGQPVAQSPAKSGRKPNVVYFLVENLGMGELSSYSGGPFRGVTTTRNLDTDPKEREPVDCPYLHTWVGAHVAKILADYEESVKHEPLIPLGAHWISWRNEDNRESRVIDKGDCHANSDAM